MLTEKTFKHILQAIIKGEYRHRVCCIGDILCIDYKTKAQYHVILYNGGGTVYYGDGDILTISSRGIIQCGKLYSLCMEKYNA